VTTDENSSDHESHGAAGQKALSRADIRSRAVAGTLLLSVKGLMLQGVGLVATIAIAHFIAPAELGKVAIGLTLTTLLAFVAGGQALGGTLIRRAESPDRRDLETVLGLQLGVSLAIAIITTAVAWPFGEIGHLTALMIWAVPIAALRTPGAVVLERDLQYRKVVSVETTETLVYQIWSVAAVAIGWGAWGLATAVLARAVTGSSLMVAVTRTARLVPRINIHRARRFLGLGMKIQATELVDSLRDQGLNMGIAAIGGLSTLGLWTMAYRALQVPVMLFNSLIRVSFPAMSRAISLGEEPRPWIDRMISMGGVATGVLLVPLAASAPALVPGLLGAKWAGAAAVLPPACLGLMVSMPVQLSCVAFLWAIGDGRTPLRATMVSSVALVGTSLALLPRLGVVSVGIGLVVACLIHVTMLAKGVRRHFVLELKGPLFVPTVVALVAGAGPWCLAYLAAPTVAAAFLTAALAEALYIAGIAIFRREAGAQLLTISAPVLLAPVTYVRRLSMTAR
jgi:O-antigen/teichoic acid export membrane protein